MVISILEGAIVLRVARIARRSTGCSVIVRTGLCEKREVVVSDCSKRERVQICNDGLTQLALTSESPLPRSKRPLAVLVDLP